MVTRTRMSLVPIECVRASSQQFPKVFIERIGFGPYLVHRSAAFTLSLPGRESMKRHVILVLPVALLFHIEHLCTPSGSNHEFRMIPK